MTKAQAEQLKAETRDLKFRMNLQVSLPITTPMYEVGAYFEAVSVRGNGYSSERLPTHKHLAETDCNRD